MLFGMLDATHFRHGSKLGETQTVRNVFIISPSKRVELILSYPAFVGRSFDEILRVIDALQLSAKYRVATPANWKPGDDTVVLPVHPGRGGGAHVWRRKAASARFDPIFDTCAIPRCAVCERSRRRRPGTAQSPRYWLDLVILAAHVRDGRRWVNCAGAGPLGRLVRRGCRALADPARRVRPRRPISSARTKRSSCAASRTRCASRRSSAGRSRPKSIPFAPIGRAFPQR